MCLNSLLTPSYDIIKEASCRNGIEGDRVIYTDGQNAIIALRAPFNLFVTSMQGVAVKISMNRKGKYDLPK